MVGVLLMSEVSSVGKIRLVALMSAYECGWSNSWKGVMRFVRKCLAVEVEYDLDAVIDRQGVNIVKEWLLRCRMK